MRICYVGHLNHGSTSLMREQILRRLGNTVFSIDTYPPKDDSFITRSIRHLRWRLNRPADEVGLNEQLQKLSANDFDVLWLDKALTIPNTTLAELKARNKDLLVIGYSPDDMANWRNNSVKFRDNLRLYDAYFTTKSYGVAELRAFGCPRVYFSAKAYDPDVHRPVGSTPTLHQQFDCDVSFVGTWERDRSDHIAFLSRNDIPVRVYGSDWHRRVRENEFLKLEYRPVYGDDYARAICCAKINLCFLRKINRDLQTSRSIEIPACGGFMLAERTNEHLELFEEGKEAEFFNSRDELLDKCRYYLKNDSLRRAIGNAGRLRCERSGYSYYERLKEIFRHIEQVRDEKSRPIIKPAPAQPTPLIESPVPIIPAKPSALSICYVGHLNFGSTSLMRASVLRKLGHSVHTIDSMLPSAKNILVRGRRHIQWRMNRAVDELGINESLLRLPIERFDVLWLDKVLFLPTATLFELKRRNPRLAIIGYSPDDMAKWWNNSVLFRDNMSAYDAYFTTKSYGVQEIKDFGCPRVYFTGNAYDPATHFPRELTPYEHRRFDCDVGFIGTWERDRSEQISAVSGKEISIRVYGSDWARQSSVNAFLRIEHKPIYGADYAKALCGAKINLCFLRKINRDLQTTRSIEIPACGAFMLAERTDEHMALFEEGKEAEFFGSRQELVEKCRYYLAHDEQRIAIAKAGRERCLRSGYSYQDRMQEIIDRIENIRGDSVS